MKNKRYLYACLLTVFFIVLFVTGIYECPIKLFLGLSCPFCGVTRAIECLFKLDFVGAFHCHLFWPAILIGIVLHILYEFNVLKKYKKPLMIMLYIFVGINFIYYIYRFASGSDIVYFNFYESLTYKLFKLFIK